MALSIKNDEADRLARELAALTGESLTEAIVGALRERIASQKRSVQTRKGPGIEERLRNLIQDLNRYPVLDARSGDDILGYDQRGLPN